MKNFFYGFLNKIRWTFNQESTDLSIKNLQRKNIDMISQIEETSEATKLIYSRLLSEIQYKSAQSHIDNRLLDKNLLGSIIKESKEQMVGNTNKTLISQFEQVWKSLTNVESDILDIKK